MTKRQKDCLNAAAGLAAQAQRETGDTKAACEKAARRYWIEAKEAAGR